VARSYYLFKSGTLKRKDNTLYLKIKDEKSRSIPVEDVQDIYVFGELTINSKLMTFLSQNGILLHFFSSKILDDDGDYKDGFYMGTYYPREKLISGKLLVKQVEHYADNQKRQIIAIKILKAAAFNIYRNLRYYNERGKNLEDEISDVKKLRSKMDKTKSIPELMGLEGNIRETYYRSWNKIVEQNIDFQKRVKRPPDNMINSILSYINTLVYTTVLGELYRTQLNPTISYLHEPGTKRFSLSLDLAEVFKPIIAERLIFSLLNKKQITEKSFQKRSNFLYLKDEARLTILKAYDQKLKATIRHKELKREVSYKHLIRLECYKLIKHLLGEKEYLGFEMWW